MWLSNLDFDTTLPMDEWPAEAIETKPPTILCFSDWRALANAIRQNPWGPAARTAETVVGWGEHYGVDALDRKCSPSLARRSHPARTRNLRLTDSGLARK